MCKKSGLELGLSQAAGPLGNLAARQADRPIELAWLAEKALPEEGISRENSEAAGASRKKVVSRSYQELEPDFYLFYMNLDLSIQ
jgi:hypothetical protein